MRARCVEEDIGGTLGLEAGGKWIGKVGALCEGV